MSNAASVRCVTADFEISTGDIDAAALAFREASVAVEAALQRLQSSLTGLGEVSGNDGPGRKFAARYDPNTVAVQENATRLSGGVRAFSDALGAATGNYSSMEAANVSAAAHAGNNP